MRRAVRTFFSIILFVLAGWGIWLFSQMNSEPLQLKFLVWRSFEAPTGVLILVTFIFGMLVSAFLFFSVILQMQFEKRRLQREVEALQRLVDERIAKEG